MNRYPEAMDKLFVNKPWEEIETKTGILPQKYMNPYMMAIARCLEDLCRYEFKRPLMATQGSILYDYVDGKVKVEVPIEISDKLLMDVIAKYEAKNKNHSALVNQDLTKNRTVINQHKAELIRCFLYNRQHVIEQLF